MLVGCIGVEVLHVLPAFLPCVAYGHGYHVTVFVEQGVKFVAEHRGEVTASELQRRRKAVQRVPFLNGIPERKDLAPGKQHIEPFVVHAVNAVAVVYALNVCGNLFLSVVVRRVNPFGRDTRYKLCHALCGKPL